MQAPRSQAQRVAARRHPLVAQVRRSLLQRCRSSEDALLALGVSGGADSLALLIACSMIRETDGRPIHAVHVHHHLRAEADDDANHVQQVCAQLAVPVTIEHVHPADGSGNLAARARMLRYQALEQAAVAIGAKQVATAHHAEDQLETMIMALCRGAGLRGLAAMDWTRPLGERGVGLIRPLLHSRQRDCQLLCDAAGISWRDDASNADVTKARARVRHDVVPVLEQLWPGAPLRAAATAEMLRTALLLIEQRVQEVFGEPSQRQWSRPALREQPPMIVAAGLRRAAVDALGETAEGLDDLSQRIVMQAAEAIADDQPQPREIALVGGLCVRITARDVTVVQSRCKA